jgi:subtilisin family serine protease
VPDVDAQGRERRSGEVILIGRTAAVEAVRNAGYAIIATRPLAAFGETLARIRVDNGQSIDTIVQQLRALAPDASVAPNHLFRPSEAEKAAAPLATTVARTAAASSGTERTATLGIIDTGVEAARLPDPHAIVATWSSDTTNYIPRAHGTAVAAIASTEGADLAVADVFGVDANNNLIASADAIAAAVDWLMSTHVPVLNISIEGPDNLVLAHVIRKATDRGAMIVAAAGNAGPAAPPVYPAAYPNVIAVTAVDDNDRIYPRANRGDYIAFAARGVRVPVTASATGQTLVSGTSFATPIVAAELARRAADAPGAKPQALLLSLQHDALDLGAPGWDPVFGWGRITAQAPARFSFSSPPTR